MEPLILTVSAFISLANELLANLSASIIGEVISVKHAASGHVYFTIKDQDQPGVLDCAIWAHQYRINGVSLTVGMQIKISGQANIYAPRGSLSFITKTITPMGEGALKQAYDMLKATLTQEGIFAQERKKTLPLFPKHIGVITSLQGAVIHDFMNNLGQHGYKISLIDSRVEGKEALSDLLKSIQTARTLSLDILVIMRGGGSLESLAAFDTEALVREISSFPVPVISAIGHHEDVPLVCLASDKQVSTPTAAAHIISLAYEQSEKELLGYSQTIFFSYQQHISLAKEKLPFYKQLIVQKSALLFEAFHHHVATIQQNLRMLFSLLPSYHKELKNYTKQIISPFSLLQKRLLQEMNHTVSSLVLLPSLQNTKQQVKTLMDDQILRFFSVSLTQQEQILVHQEKTIALRNPMNLLSQGYSIIQSGNSLVKQTKDVTIGQSLRILLRDGTITSEVTNVEKQKHYE